ncbi:MAG: type II secretion system protein N [Burkholderiales bacterium]
MKIRLPSLINLALLVALAAVVSYWVMQISAQRSPGEPLVSIPAGDSVTQNQPLDTISAASLFGPSSSTQGPGRVVLIGIIGEGGKGSGVALLSVDGQPPVAYKVGESIQDDQELVAVHSDRVTIGGAGGNQEIRMPERAAPTGIESVRQ